MSNNVVRLCVVIAGVFLGGGCSSSHTASACVPGRSLACVGPGGCAGGQVCTADGTGFSVCTCYEVVDAGEAPDGAIDAGSFDSAVPDSAVPDSAVPDSAVPDSAVPDSGPVTCATRGASATFVMDVIDVGREDPVGVAPGYDLDMRVSDDTDPLGCFQPDFISPSGTPGIDNQLAVLTPTLESAAGIDLAASIADGIDSGSLLLMPVVEDLDDRVNDPCVSFSLLIGQVPGGGWPRSNSAGTLEVGQTFDIDPASYDASGAPSVHLDGAAVVDGHLEVGPLDLALALPVSGMTLTLNIHHAVLSFDIAPDGSAITGGVLAGDVVVEELIAEVVALGGGLPVDLVRNVLTSTADRFPNAAGDCESLSLAIVFHGIPAVQGARL